MRKTFKEISKTRKLINKGKEQWNELPLWLKIFIPYSILYYLSTRKGPIGFVAKTILFFLSFLVLFPIIFGIWTIFTYRQYLPFVFIIGCGVFFAWFFTVIYYRRQGQHFEERCMEGLKEKYNIEDDIEEVAEVKPLKVHTWRTRDEWNNLPHGLGWLKLFTFFFERKDHMDVEYICGECGRTQYYENLRIDRGKKDFWMVCPDCNAYNWFGISAVKNEDGAQVISHEDRINLL